MAVPMANLIPLELARAKREAAVQAVHVEDSRWTFKEWGPPVACAVAYFAVLAFWMAEVAAPLGHMLEALK